MKGNKIGNTSLIKSFNHVHNYTHINHLLITNVIKIEKKPLDKIYIKLY